MPPTLYLAAFGNKVKECYKIKYTFQAFGSPQNFRRHSELCHPLFLYLPPNGLAVCVTIKFLGFFADLSLAFGIGAIQIIPILASLGISFTNFQMLEPENTQFIGLDNYALFKDEAVRYLLFETVASALSTIPLQLIASIILAALLASPRLKGKSLTRTLFSCPSVIPSIAILFMWFGFLDPTTGWLNRFLLEPLGLGGQGGIFSEGAYQFVFAISSLWSIGRDVDYAGGDSTVFRPKISRPARVDGAGPMMRFSPSPCR